MLRKRGDQDAHHEGGRAHCGGDLEMGRGAPRGRHQAGIRLKASLDRCTADSFPKFNSGATASASPLARIYTIW